MINKAIQSIALVLLLTLYFTGIFPHRMDATYMTYILSVAGFCLFSFLVLRPEKVADLKKQYIRISYIFLFSFVVVHFQAYIDFLLGNLDQGDNFFWIDKGAVPKSLLLSSIGLISYLLGYSLLSGGRRQPKENPNKEKQMPRVVNPNFMFWLGLLLILMFYGTVDSNYLKGNYGVENIGTVAGYSTLLFEACVYTILIHNCRMLLITGRTKLTFFDYVLVQKRAAGLLLLYLPTMVIIGDRGPLIYLSLGFFFGFIYVTKKKVPLFALVLLIGVTTITLTIIGLVRRQGDSGGTFSSKLSGAMKKDKTLEFYPRSFSNNTKELAGSVRTLHIAVSNVPEPLPHFNGLFFAQDAMLLVPSLRNVFTKMAEIPEEFGSSSQLLTTISQGSQSEWGVGTTCIADTYLDWDVYGVVVVYFLFGLLCRRMELLTFSKELCSVAALICIFLIFSFCVYIARSTIAYSLNKFTYVAVFSTIPLLFRKRKKKVVRRMAMSLN